MNLTLAWPLLLWGLGLVPLLVVAYALDGQRRRRVLERIGHLPQMKRLTASVSLGRRRAKAVMVVGAVALLVLAAAQPQLPGQAHVLPRRGLDIVVALDFSRSMLAADIYPNRLARAKAELDKLIDGLKGDRVGLVAFAGVTLTYPLTTDYAAAKLFWRDLHPEDIPVGGTNLGEAIRAALESLAHAHDHDKDPRKPSQIIVLLTDGADTEGGAMEAVKAAAQAGVRIFPVGIGSREGEVVVLARKDDGSADYVTDPEGKPVRMELDEAALRQMAQATSGEYFPFDAERFGVERVQKAIAGLERKEEEGRVVREPDEAYGWFAGAALALLLVELLLGDRRRRGAEEARAQLAAEPEVAPHGRRLGSRRRIDPTGTGSIGTSQKVAALLLLLLPMLGGWSWFERKSPDVERGRKALADGKPAGALSAFERALEASPQDLALHYDRGEALYALKKFPEALAEFQRAAESPDPKLRADAWYNAGNTLVEQQKLKEAVDAYKRALRLKPDDRRAKWNLELALRKLLEEEQKKQQQQQQANDDKTQKQQQDQSGDKHDQPPDKQAADDSAQPRKPEQPKDDQKDQPQQQQAKGEKKKEPQPGQPDDKNQQQQQQQQQQAAGGDEKKDDPKNRQKAQAGQAAAGGQPVRDIDKQDAEAVLDAFERVEPTVQKDLAKRRAGSRRPRKDW